MHILYIDESGDLGSLSHPALPNDQPVLVLGGLIVSAARLEGITQDFLSLKHRWFPGLPYPSHNHLDRILPEIKGADLRRTATRGTKRQMRQTMGFLEKLLEMLVHHDAKLIARVWVKQPASAFNGRSLYTSSIQGMYTYFQHFLNQNEELGVSIADSRNPSKNANVAHSVFTAIMHFTNPFVEGI